jgi:putative membrane protein
MRNFLFSFLAAVAASTCMFVVSSPAGTPGADSVFNAEDQKFVENVWNIDVTETRLGDIAQKNAASDDVKAFAKHMVDDHSKNFASLNELRKEHNGAFPRALDKENQDLVDRLSKLTGADFDKEYITAMVMGHQKAIAMFQTESHGAEAATDQNPGHQTSANRWAAAYLPTLKEHLQMARKTAKDLGVDVPDAVQAADHEGPAKDK